MSSVSRGLPISSVDFPADFLPLPSELWKSCARCGDGACEKRQASASAVRPANKLRGGGARRGTWRGSSARAGAWTARVSAWALAPGRCVAWDERGRADTSLASSSARKARGWVSAKPGPSLQVLLSAAPIHKGLAPLAW